MTREYFIFSSGGSGSSDSDRGEVKISQKSNPAQEIAKKVAKKIGEKKNQSYTCTYTCTCTLLLLDYAYTHYFNGLGDRKRRSVGGNGCAASEEIENILDGDDVPLVEEVAQKQFWNR